MKKNSRQKVLNEIKKQAMAQAAVSNASQKVDINDPNYADKIMDLIADEVIDNIINQS